MLNLEDAVFSINLHEQAPLPLIRIGGIVNTLKNEILTGMDRTFTGGATPANEGNEDNFVEKYLNPHLKKVAQQYCNNPNNSGNCKDNDIEKAILYFYTKSKEDKELIQTNVKRLTQLEQEHVV